MIIVYKQKPLQRKQNKIGDQTKYPWTLGGESSRRVPMYYIPQAVPIFLFTRTPAKASTYVLLSLRFLSSCLKLVTDYPCSLRPYPLRVGFNSARSRRSRSSNNRHDVTTPTYLYVRQGLTSRSFGTFKHGAGAHKLG